MQRYNYLFISQSGLWTKMQNIIKELGAMQSYCILVAKMQKKQYFCS